MIFMKCTRYINASWILFKGYKQKFIASQVRRKQVVFVFDQDSSIFMERCYGKVLTEADIAQTHLCYLISGLSCISFTSKNVIADCYFVLHLTPFSTKAPIEDTIGDFWHCIAYHRVCCPQLSYDLAIVLP